MKSHIAACAIAAGISLARPAHADDLVIRTIEYPTWPAAVAAVQASIHSEGLTIRVATDDSSGHPVGCGAYTLSLDAVASRAFVLGACDPQSNATEVRLMNRAALFGPGALVPEPLAAGITATRLQSGTARGGAGVPGGSDVRCSIAVRPFLRDLLHGTNVYITPGGYVLRVLSQSVSVSPDEAGWVLRGPRTMTIEYDVVDSRTARVVLRDRATMTCGDTAVAATTASRAAPIRDTAHPTETMRDRRLQACDAAPLLAAVNAGSTLGGTNVFESARGNGWGLERVYRLRVGEQRVWSLRLNSHSAALLYIRSDCADADSEIRSDSAFVDGHDRTATIDVSLAPGEYYVIVDGFNYGRPSDAGSFTLTAEPQ